MRKLLRGGMVVSLDPAVGDLPQGDVLIEDGRIVAVAAVVDAADAEAAWTAASRRGTSSSSPRWTAPGRADSTPEPAASPSARTPT
jgi:cytosine/adenosine deaminase-related metal-dependent hydrolase